MPDQIQGKSVVIRVYQNGRLIRGINCKKFEWEGDDEIRSRELLGRTTAQRTLINSGYKGTFDIDVDSGRHHEIIKFIDESSRSGVAAYQFSIKVQEQYTDGTFKNYLFTNVVMRIPKTTVSSRKDDVSVTFTWEAEFLTYTE